MKKIIMIGIALTVIHNAKGEDIMNSTLENQTIKDGSFVGSTDLTDVKVEELSVMGPLKFHNLTVDGDSDIMGSVRESQKGTFRDLSVLLKPRT